MAVGTGIHEEISGRNCYRNADTASAYSIPWKVQLTGGPTYTNPLNHVHNLNWLHTASKRQGTFLLDIGRRTVVTVNLQLSRKCGASVHLLWLPSRAISTANCNINDAMETLTNNHQGGFPFLD
jgi:hypothetical protein